jgi:hypothetical protein
MPWTLDALLVGEASLSSRLVKCCRAWDQDVGGVAEGRESGARMEEA